MGLIKKRALEAKVVNADADADAAVLRYYLANN